jgi:addiction module RelB/DinJ family antitoxin
MPSTSITVRMDTDLKKQFETLLDEVGLNMTTAITVFANAVTRQRKIPFEIEANSLPPFPNDISRMSKAEFDAMVQEGMDSIKAGRTISADKMNEKWERRFSA